MNAAELEQIVSEVVRRLVAASDNARAASEEPQPPTTSFASQGGTSGLPVRFAKTKYTPDTVAEPLAGSQLSAEKDVLVCTERVLTLAKVDGHLDGLRRLVVPRKAIITPALKEELLKRNIAVEREGQRTGTRADFAISVVRFDADRAPALHGLGLADEILAKSLAVVINTVNSQLALGNRHVLVLTRQATAVLCLLNRSSHVRAASATNVESVKAAAKQIGANVLVVDPASLSRVQLSALIRAFENEGECPIPRELQG